MHAHTLPEWTQAINPLFAVALLVCAARQLRRAAPPWIGAVALTTLLILLACKLIQHLRVEGAHFPSTHFAFALAVAGAFCALNRRYVPPVIAFVAAYGALILWRHFHTPVEMLGSLPAFPLSFGVAQWSQRRTQRSVAGGEG